MTAETVLEILDASVVVVYSTPTIQPTEAATLFDGNTPLPHFRLPYNINQVLAVDAARPTGIMQQIESMRSQKTIAIAPTKLEIHDKSDSPIARVDQLAALLETLIAKLAPDTEVFAIGANLEATALVKGPVLGATLISNKLLMPQPSYLPKGLNLLGGSVRLHLNDDTGTTFLAAIEPRFNDPKSQEIFFSVNASSSEQRVPSGEIAKHLVSEAWRVLTDVAKAVL